MPRAEPSSPSSSRPLPAALSEKLDALVKALLDGRDAIEAFRQGNVPFDVLNTHLANAAAARASLDAALRGMLDDADRLDALEEHVVMKGPLLLHGNEEPVCGNYCGLGFGYGLGRNLREALDQLRRAARPEASADA